MSIRSFRRWLSATRVFHRMRRLRGMVSAVGVLFSPSGFGLRWRNLLLWAKIHANPDSRHALKNYYVKEYYLNQYPDVAAAGIPGLLHYICVGCMENRKTSEDFDGSLYLETYPDVAASELNPLLHYVSFGAREGRMAGRRMTDVEPSDGAGLSALPPSTVHIDNRWPADLPLISVVIPCFNYGAYVAEAIESVLQQTFSRLEVIVVEGGSTDGFTTQRVKELEAKYPSVRFFFRRGRHLAGDNRNYGIRCARGRYTCCLDADDLIRPIYLEVAVFLAERYGFDLVYPSIQCFGGSEFRWLVTDASFHEISNMNQVSTVALFRKEAWAALGGFRDWGQREDYIFEDWDFWVRMVGNGFRVKSIREPLMMYRVHDSGLASACTNDREYQKHAIAKANSELFKSPRPPREVEVIDPWANLEPRPRTARRSLLLALPFLTVGGADKLFCTLVCGLVERGYHVSVITTLLLPESMTTENSVFDGLTHSVYHLPGLFSDREHWPEFIRFLLTRYSVDTIMIAGCEFVYHLLPAIAREFPKIHVIDQLFNDTGHIANNRRYAEFIDLNVVPSQALATTLTHKYGENQEKVKIIPHGVAPDVPTYNSRAEAFSASGLPVRSTDKFLVSFFGRLSEEKWPQAFVEIARRLSGHPDIDFCMTGEGPERSAVLELIARYELQDRIFAPGFVPDVRPLIACSNVVVVPSRLDGMPLIVLEAQMFGKPVVASAVGSLPEMVADGVSGYICTAGDIAAFASRIEDLHASPELCRDMGERGRTAALERYDARNMIKAYVEAFEADPVLRETASA